LQTFLLVSLCLAWALLIILAGAVFALYRHFGQMYLSSPAGRTDQGPEIGTPLLSISRESLDGQRILLPARGPSVVLFADTSCDLCSAIRDELSVLDPYSSKLQVAVFCAGLTQDVAAWAGRVPSYVQVISDDRASAAQHFRVSTLPFAIAVGLGGEVRAKSIVNGAEGLLWAAEHALDITASEEPSEVARA